MNKSSGMVDKLRQYLTSLTQEEFDKEWNEIEKLGLQGPILINNHTENQNDWNTMIPPDVEYIICAAIWYPNIPNFNPHQPINIDEGTVLCGWRHGSIIGQFNALTGKSTTRNDIQGFLTSKNRFLNRKEARELHIKNGFQAEFKDELYSEDLY